jgi:hypothetical protein
MTGFNETARHLAGLPNSENSSITSSTGPYFTQPGGHTGNLPVPGYAHGHFDEAMVQTPAQVNPDNANTIDDPYAHEDPMLLQKLRNDMGYGWATDKLRRAPRFK